MRHIMRIFMTALCSIPVQAQPVVTKDQQAVQQTVIYFFDALSNRDSVRLKTYCTPDISLYEYGKVWTIDTLVTNAIKRNTAVDFKRTNSFDFISTTTDKTTAWVTYRLRSTIVKNAKLTTSLWLETVTLANVKKRWKVRHLHSTLLERS